MVIFSGPIRTSLTRSRRTRCCSAMSAVAAWRRSWARKPSRSSASFQVCLTVGELALQGVELAAQVRLAGPHAWHPAPQLVDGDQLFLICLDHAGDAGAGLVQGQLEAVVLAGGGI